jgi:hypothetical protein
MVMEVEMEMEVEVEAEVEVEGIFLLQCIKRGLVTRRYRIQLIPLYHKLRIGQLEDWGW